MLLLNPHLKEGTIWTKLIQILVVPLNNMQPYANSPQINSLSKWNSQETAVCFNRVKISCLSAAIGRFLCILFVSDYQDSLAVTIIRQQKMYFVMTSDWCYQKVQ